jgi:hypothetical protein
MVQGVVIMTPTQEWSGSWVLRLASLLSRLRRATTIETGMFADISRLRFGADTVEKVCFPNQQNFPEALARPYENYIGEHIVRPISNRQPS